MNVIETLQNQLEEESSKAKENEDAQSLNSSENAEEEGSEMEVREDADSIDEDAVSVSKRRKLSNAWLPDGEESTQVDAQECADETPDVVAESTKGDKAEKPSPLKKPDAGATEGLEPAKRGRGRPKKATAQNNSGAN
ncbi:hypothetical protein SASPL_130143 [Salvia splendens]|uniref:Uncharacterized protein n=1 Tax=Salvia splendens TaxID=180675 RepID=A0A8X8ZKD3_SALSN|nr:hypothetical protein SASPL_130143 [Salvia splendens]